MNTDKKTYLVIGYSKEDHIKAAAQQGQHLILLIQKQPYLKYKEDCARFFEKVLVLDDIYRWDELKPKLDSLPKLDAVVTRYDHYVNILGVINEYLDLRGLDYTATRNFSNKYLMKQCFQQSQVPCADGICVDQLAGLKTFIDNHDFPLIIKTTTGTHSRYVFKVGSKNDLLQKRQLILNQALGDLSSKVVSGFKSGQDCQALVEETLTGIEVSVDTFVSAGSFLHTPVCEYVTAEQLNVDDSYLPIRTMPARLDSDLEHKILEIVEQALQSLAADYCVCHTELFINEDGNNIQVVETTPRGGGNRAEMTELATGFDYNLAVFKAVSGELMTKKLAVTQAVSVVEYFSPHDGTIKNIDLSFLQDHPQVSNIKIRNQEGDSVKQARHGGKNIVLFFVTSDNSLGSKELAIDLFKKVQTAVAVGRKD